MARRADWAGTHIRRFDMAIEGGCYCGEIR